MRLVSFLLSLVLTFSPLVSLAQEPTSTPENLIPVFFFLHHTETENLGILAVAPLEFNLVQHNRLR